MIFEGRKGDVKKPGFVKVDAPIQDSSQVGLQTVTGLR